VAFVSELILNIKELLFGQKKDGRRRVITFGTFDLLHEGHIRLLERARAEGDYLIVGISTDSLNALKGKSAMFPQAQRKAYVDALEVVDETFLEESLEQKDEYIKRYNADLLVMGDDWKHQFDWVSSDVKYLARTRNVSSSEIKGDMLKSVDIKRILFGDTHISKHYDCAMSMVNEMLAANIAPIFTQNRTLHRNLDVDCIVYFNLPSEAPPSEYDGVPRVCIDHGASNLKWFLASKERFEFFDRIITAGPDHSRSILSFYPESGDFTRVHSAGFIKAPDLLSPPKFSRNEVAKMASVNPNKPITLFVPTWYITNNPDMQIAIDQMANIENHVTILHPETRHLDVSAVNVMENTAGIVTEMLKHADCVVSDLSSTIFEAAAIKKPVVQILMKEYSDNNATQFDFPYVAGTADLYCGGIFCRPDKLTLTVVNYYADPVKFEPMLKACRERILRGTTIDDGVAKKITSELLIACKEGKPDVTGINLDEIRHTGMTGVAENLAYSRHVVIAHGGGDFNSHHASNSREAIRNSLLAVGMVEVDLVLGKDDILLAHNGFEERYGLDKPFAEVTADEFRALKYKDTLQTLTLSDFFELFASVKGRVVFDIKDMDEDYDAIATAIKDIAEQKGLIDRVVVQAYCKRDFDTLNRLGFRRTILAVWKYYYLDPLGPDAHEFITSCLKINQQNVFGISIPYYNHHMSSPSIDHDGLLPFYGYFKRVFIHGAPQERYPDILRLNLGVFADAFKKGIQFKDVSGRFGWRRYLFLNPELVAEGIDNQISAVCHYYEWGEKEGRRTDYNLPKEFVPNRYLDKNADLRQAGISGADSAKAHWTLHGSDQARPF
jgi:glycerol-3-phosphate cytidylyltransferase